MSCNTRRITAGVDVTRTFTGSTAVGVWRIGWSGGGKLGKSSKDESKSRAVHCGDVKLVSRSKNQVPWFKKEALEMKLWVEMRF